MKAVRSLSVAITLLLCATPALLLAQPLDPPDPVDQFHIAPPTANLAAVYVGQEFGQTFTVGRPGLLTEVAMYVDRRGAPVADLVLEVQGVSGGQPSGNVLASATLPASAVISGLNAFDISAAEFSVRQGDVLAAVLKSTAALGNDYLARARPTNAYAAGQAVSRLRSSGFVWGAFGDSFDAIFQTRVRPQVVAFVRELVGEVTVSRHDGSLHTLALNETVALGETVETSSSGAVVLEFFDDTMITLAESTRVRIDEHVMDSVRGEESLLTLLQGALIYVSGLIGRQDEDARRLETPGGCICIRGTEFIARYDESTGTQDVYLIHGQVGIIPDGTGVTTEYVAPVSLFFDSFTITTAPLTQTAYDAMKAQLFFGTCIDADGDGICDDADNCAGAANPAQDDSDGDGSGDACDLDDDADGRPDAQDNCPSIHNPDQTDFDSDGLGSACDIDDDADGVFDGADVCRRTDRGAAVDEAGCSIAQLCPCNGGWKNHESYVSCVSVAANAFVAAGKIGGKEKGAVTAAAGKSSCGKR